jgi:hypothetical protein
MIEPGFMMAAGRVDSRGLMLVHMCSQHAPSGARPGRGELGQPPPGTGPDIAVGSTARRPLGIDDDHDDDGDHDDPKWASAVRAARYTHDPGALSPLQGALLRLAWVGYAVPTFSAA